MKLNSSLLKDKQYVTEIKDTIKRVKEQYAVMVNKYGIRGPAVHNIRSVVPRCAVNGN